MREIQINLDLLKQNLSYIKSRANLPVLAVVKADAYGHGLIPCAKAAIEGGADYLGVALLEEALILREAGVTAPLLAWLLPPGEDYKKAVAFNIELGVSSIAVFDEINSIPGAKIHLEVESGMGRGGFLNEWPELLKRDLSKVVGIFTHFARADEPSEAQNQLQISNFEKFVSDLNKLGIKPIRHISNTAATLSGSSGGYLNKALTNYDMVRIGIAMYGYSPLERDENLKPVMTLRSKLVLVKDMPAGHPIGYGATEVTKSNTKIGIVGLGYADGIPRNARGAGVSFEGKKAPMIGRVSMDQFVVDLGADSRAKSGDWVTVFGGEYSVYDWAVASQTITYEITTRIGRHITRLYIPTER